MRLITILVRAQDIFSRKVWTARNDADIDAAEQAQAIRDRARDALTKRVEALAEAAQRVVTNANIGAKRSVYLVSHEDLMALQAALAALRK